MQGVLFGKQFKRMPRRMLKRLRGAALYAENNDGAGGWGSTGSENDQGKSDNNNDAPDTSKGDDGKKEGETIPKYRFDQVNEERKQLKAQLDQINADKAKAEEQEAIKRGEHEKIIAQKDQELADYKAKEERRKEREDALKSKNEARQEALKTAYGDKWGTVSNLLTGVEDPFKTAGILDSIEAMKPTTADDKKDGNGDNKQAPKGGSDLPSGQGQGRLAELKAKAERWERLSDREKRELYDLIEGKK